jgi:DNA-binding Lrp family transcriptional regulator
MKRLKRNNQRPRHPLSDKDRLILAALHNNGVADSPKEIADVTKLNESTVSKHLRKLRMEGYVTTAVNLQHEIAYRALVSIDLDLTRMKGPKHGYRNQQEFVRFLKVGLQKSTQFKAFTEGIVVEDVYSLLGGRADVSILAGAKDVGAMFDFVTRVIHALPGVKNTNTAAIVKTGQLKP